MSSPLINDKASNTIIIDMVQTDTCSTIQLEAGWNLFSSPVILDTSDMLHNFQHLIDKGSLVKIQDEAGWSLENRGIFGGWVNDIGDIVPTEGYKIKVNAAENIQFCGLQVEYPYPIPLSEGWNIIGYPGIDTINGMDLVGELIDKGTLVKVQDEEGNSIENLGSFGGWQNFIGDIYNGEGYLVKVLTSDTLWIYENYSDTTQTPKPPGLGFSVVANSLSTKSGNASRLNTKNELGARETKHFKTAYSGNGVDHMSFNVVQLPVNLLTVGDEIAVFDGTMCVGSTIVGEQHIENNIIQIAASSADKYGMQGFTEGNNYKIRYWKAESGQEQELSFDFVSGEEVFTSHESVILSLAHGIELGLENDEPVDINFVCFPNPFNKELTIQFNLTNVSQVTISVFDQQGQKVASLLNQETFIKGSHHISWDGKGTGNQKLSSGIYFLQVFIDDLQYHEKIVLNH